MVDPEGELYGILHVGIHRAKDLPNMDSGVNNDFTDAYVRVVLDGKKGPRTDTIDNSLNPVNFSFRPIFHFCFWIVQVWEQQFELPIAGRVHSLVFDVKDEGLVGVDHIGSVALNPREFVRGFRQEWFQVTFPND